MKYLKNSFDSEVEFTDLEKAKNYYMPNLEEFSDDEEYQEYLESIKECNSLFDLASILNNYTDMYGNGSTFSVKVVDTVSRKEVDDILEKLDTSVMYFTETPLNFSSWEGWYDKYFLCWQNTHQICAGFETLDDLYDYLVELREEDTSLWLDK